MNEVIPLRYFSPFLRFDWIYGWSNLKKRTDGALKIVNDFTDKAKLAAKIFSVGLILFITLFR